MLNVFVGMFFKSVVNAPRAAFVVAVRDGLVFDVVRVLRRSNARDVVAPVGRVPVRARVEELSFTRVVVFVRLTTLVVVRDIPDVSRDVVVLELLRDNEPVPRTAADDAPTESAIATIEIISLFISVYARLAKNKNPGQV
jgi:hypothetical protein